MAVREAPRMHANRFLAKRSDSSPTTHSLLLNLNEVLSVRSTRVKLTRDGLPLNVSSGENKNVPPNALYIYYTFRRNVYIWRVREASVFFTTTTEKKQWSEMLNKTLKELYHRPKNLLIFVNPFGGKGKAKNVYSKQIEPLLDLVGVQRQVIETERANHAFDLIKEMDAEEWTSYDGLISVGGDGLFNEVLSSAVDIADLNVDHLVTPRVRFGIIGAGSANSIVSSIHGVDDTATAGIHIVIGSKCGVDVCTVHEENKLLKISANAISYGWLGDVLHDSEHYRCMGPIRYQWSALRTSIRHPTYFGRVSFALTNLTGGDVQSSMLEALPPCSKPCVVCDGTVKEDQYPHHWQTDFTHVICCVVPCVSPFTPYGLAPYAGVGDGSMDLALVPKVSRFENLQIMRKVSMYGGRGLIRLQNTNVHVFRVSRWKFTPAAIVADQNNTEGLDENALQGAWNLDGEILPQPAMKPLHFRLHPCLINFFGRELDLEDPRYRKCLCCAKPIRYSNLVVLGS
ncbi:diacylglycerol kinase catalytic domain-containing protein [Ditylenchus destructor]|uniref:Diacylglycerol kinase catalytic domain-containing protein n=1 Tax=Ditylenchus destructor TaxID=166010 RepID=A0AAD4N005_9BILA|nr:diacylglycerol kinase catalytic domain-containing protein [Ditylenchus destructor]